MPSSLSSQATEGRILPTLVSPSSDAVPGLTDEDGRRIAAALHHARSPNTRAAYAAAWLDFTHFLKVKRPGTTSRLHPS